MIDSVRHLRKIKTKKKKRHRREECKAFPFCFKIIALGGASLNADIRSLLLLYCRKSSGEKYSFFCVWRNCSAESFMKTLGAFTSAFMNYLICNHGKMILIHFRLSWKIYYQFGESHSTDWQTVFNLCNNDKYNNNLRTMNIHICAIFWSGSIEMAKHMHVNGRKRFIYFFLIPPNSNNYIAFFIHLLLSKWKLKAFIVNGFAALVSRLWTRTKQNCNRIMGFLIFHNSFISRDQKKGITFWCIFYDC